MKSFSAHIEEISSGGLTIFQRKMRSLLLNELLPSLKPETYFTLLLAIRIIIRSRLIGSVLYYSDQLYAQRIGHLAYNIESCLLSINADTNKLYYSCLLLHRNKPSNEFLIKVWKRNPNLTIIRVNPLTHRLLNFILEKLKSYMPVKKIDWEKLHPTANLDSLSPSIFSLDAQDLLARRSMLINLGINSSLYVSMHNRDAGYLLKTGQDSNYHDYRDFDFGSLTLLINYLSSRGVFTVRHGKYQLSPTNKLSSQLLIDLSNKSEMDSHDVLLVSDSLFFVGCSTGFSMIPRLFRKPCLLVNYVPFRLDEVCMMSPNSIFLPKLFFHKEEKRLLSFSEIANLSYDIHSKDCPFTKIGLEIINNSPDEILEAGIEMYKTAVGEHCPDQDSSYLQDKFWNSVSDVKGSEEAYAVGQRISNSFLRKYSFLI